MIKKATLDFLKQLANNNDRGWFNAHKEEFQQAKANVEEFAANLIDAIDVFDERIGELVPKRSVFRIYRDARFSKDKRPYKTNFGIHLTPGGKNSGHAGYYVHIEPGKSFLGGGIWHPDRANLDKVRAVIAKHGNELEKILKKPSFKNYFKELLGDALKTAPRGYDIDHPYINYLRFKDLTVWHKVSDAKMRSKEFVSYAAKAFKIMKPFDDFLNKAIFRPRGRH